jgi:hypothetical protein
MPRWDTPPGNRGSARKTRTPIRRATIRMRSLRFVAVLKALGQPG